MTPNESDNCKLPVEVILIISVFLHRDISHTQQRNTYGMVGSGESFQVTFSIREPTETMRNWKERRKKMFQFNLSAMCNMKSWIFSAFWKGLAIKDNLALFVSLSPLLSLTHRHILCLSLTTLTLQLLRWRRRQNGNYFRQIAIQNSLCTINYRICRDKCHSRILCSSKKKIARESERVSEKRRRKKVAEKISTSRCSEYIRTTNGRMVFPDTQTSTEFNFVTFSIKIITFGVAEVSFLFLLVLCHTSTLTQSRYVAVN